MVMDRGNILFFERDEEAVGVVKDFTVILARVTFNWSIDDWKQLLHIVNEHLIEQPLVPHLQERILMSTFFVLCRTVHDFQSSVSVCLFQSKKNETSI